jgi:hypothetical protein
MEPAIDKLSLDDVKRWRIAADTMRALADELSDKMSQETARRIADDYDLLAARVEAQLKAPPSDTTP